MNEIKNIIKTNNTNWNSPSKDVQSIDRKSPVKKQKNVPAQIWAKRNILKKLTLQLKFNKNQTKQYKKIRTQIQESIQVFTYKNQQKKAQNKQKTSQTISPKNQNNIQKLCNAKSVNSPKYTENLFALNTFSANGLKSFHVKSITCQGNNFINVSKAIITQKNKNQTISKPYSHRKLSFSHRQKYSQNIPKKKHQRSKSFAQNQTDFEEIQQKNASEFLKVSTKKIHFNNFQNSHFQNNIQEKNSFMNKEKIKTNNNLTVLLERRKSIQNQIKINLTRPKSCIVKARKPVELSICQGWNIKNSARQQEESFPNYCRF